MPRYGKGQKGKKDEGDFSKKFDSKIGAGRSGMKEGKSIVGSTSGNRPAPESAESRADRFNRIMSGTPPEINQWQREVAGMKTRAAEHRKKYYADKLNRQRGYR